MKTVTITRYDTSDNGTFGILNVEGMFTCLTLELPWCDNLKNISCIPAGEYIVEPIISPKFGAVYEIIDVPGRTHVYLHPGNTIRDTNGCTLLGLIKGVLGDLPAVLNSKTAFKYFRQVVGRVRFKLIIEVDYNKIDDCMVLPPHCRQF